MTFKELNFGQITHKKIIRIMNKESALKEKEMLIQSDLDEWLRTSPIFSAGDAVKITLSLERVPTTILANSQQINVRTIEDTANYRYIRSEMSVADWNELSSARLPKKVRKAIKYLQSVGNVPTKDSLLGKRFRTTSRNVFNCALRSRGLKFQLVRVGSEENQKPFGFTIYYQLYKVEPKKPVLKFWKL